MDAKERVIVITGATGGLGRVASSELAQRGYRLALFSNDAAQLQQLSAQLNLPAERLVSEVVDLRTSQGARNALATVMQKFHRVDALLHVVGGWTGGVPLVEIEPQALEDMLGQHVWTTFHLAQAFVPQLVANHWGRIIVVSSPVAALPPPKIAAYAAGKAAQESLILSLAAELQGTGVTANVLRVSSIDVKHARDNEPSPKNANWTTPEEITAAILFLLSEPAGVVNGARLPLYGSL